MAVQFSNRTTLMKEKKTAIFAPINYMHRLVFFKKTYFSLSGKGENIIRLLHESVETCFSALFLKGVKKRLASRFGCGAEEIHLIYS